MDDRPDVKTSEMEDTGDPKDPPNSMMRRDTRRRVLLSYLGPVIALFVVAGIALIYWASRGPVAPEPQDRERDAVGTFGVGSKEGGFNPAPEFDSTRDELNFRGSNTSGVAEQEPGGRQASSSAGATLTSLESVVNSSRSGARVEIHGVEVASVENGTIWIRDGDTRIAVIDERGAAGVKPGALVDVTGETEADPSGTLRIRALKVEPGRG
jgi:hypothetical protein